MVKSLWQKIPRSGKMNSIGIPSDHDSLHQRQCKAAVRLMLEDVLARYKNTKGYLER